MAEPFIQIKIDEASLKEAQHVLRAIPGAYPRVMRRSINRAIDMTFTRYKRAIAEQITIGPSLAGRGLKKEKATMSKQSGALLADPSRIPLGLFESKQIKQTKAALKKIKRGVASRLGSGLGVRYRIGTATKMIPGAFITMMVGKKGGAKGDLRTSAAERRSEWEASGLTPKQIRKVSHRGVYKRRGPPRLPIYEAHGPSIWYVAVNNKALSNKLPAKTIFDFSKLFNDQITVEFKNWSNRGRF